LNKNIKRILIYSASAIAILILVIFVLPKITGTKAADDKERKPRDNKLLADGFIIKMRDLENSISAAGTIRANEEVEIRSEVSRRLTGINFREGTYVSRGQTLFSLDASDIHAQLNKLNIAEALQMKTIERNTYLVEKGLMPLQENDIAQAQLDQTRADMNVLRVQLVKTSIRAPFSGIVGLRNVSRGSYVTPGDVLTTLQDISRVKIDFSIPERYSNSFTKGQDITFKIDGSDETFTAEIYAAEPQLNENTRSVLIRAVASNPGGKLKPGSFANVTINLNAVSDAVMIPSQALIPKLKGHQVFIVRNNKSIPVNVEIGTRTENEVQIISPEIRQGDTLITTNILQLKPNGDIKIVNINSGQ
jgi:membrane fusion protein (multidrug efflux system)